MTTTPEAGMRLVPETLVRFLLGEGELDGLSFGDAKPVSGGRHGRFWWRTALRSCAAAPVPPAGGEGERRLKLAICGGEDVPGVIDTVSVEDCERFLAEERANRYYPEDARAQPPGGEVVIGEEGEVYTAAHLKRLLDGRDAFIVNQGLWPAFCDQCYTHPTEPAARDGGEADFTDNMQERAFEALMEQYTANPWEEAREVVENIDFEPIYRALLSSRSAGGEK